MDQFCQLTSLHGWNYCFRPEKPKIHTAGWILVIVTAVISAIALVVGILMEFREATVSVTLSTTTAPLDDFMFPAVTICNTLQIKKSVVSRLANELGNVTEDEIVDVASLLIQTRHGQLNADQLNIRDRIIGSQVISDIADEMVDKIYKDREVTEEEMYRKQPLTVSKYHSIFNRGKPFEKTFDNLLGLFPQFVNQLDPVDTVSGIYMATASFTEFAKGTNTDFGDTCLWMPFLGYNATMTDFDFLLKGVRTGVSNGAWLLLDTEAFDQASSRWNSEGFLINLQNPRVFSLIEVTGIRIRPGTFAHFALSPRSTSTTPEVRSRFTPEQRKCYFGDEIELPHLINLLTYSLTSCVQEAKLQEVEKQCQCSMSGFELGGLPICSGEKRACAEKAELEASNRGDYTINDGQRCLEQCEEQHFEIATSEMTFPDYESFHRSPDFTAVVRKVLRICGDEYKRASLSAVQPNICPIIDSLSPDAAAAEEELKRNRDFRLEIAEYARRNTVKLVIYVREGYATHFIREEKITVLSLVGSVGGLLGLFLGCSFISLVEIIYFAVERVVFPLAFSSSPFWRTAAAPKGG